MRETDSATVPGPAAFCATLMPSKLRWRKKHSFGGPVVPEVNRASAGVSPSPSNRVSGSPTSRGSAPVVGAGAEVSSHPTVSGSTTISAGSAVAMSRVRSSLLIWTFTGTATSPACQAPSRHQAISMLSGRASRTRSPVFNPAALKPPAARAAPSKTWLNVQTSSSIRKAALSSHPLSRTCSARRCVRFSVIPTDGSFTGHFRFKATSEFCAVCSSRPWRSSTGREHQSYDIHALKRGSTAWILRGEGTRGSRLQRRSTSVASERRSDFAFGAPASAGAPTGQTNTESSRAISRPQTLTRVWMAVCDLVAGPESYRRTP